MEKEMVHTTHSASAGDAAVSGMFVGLLGGVAMAAVIAGYSLIAGQGLAYLGDFSTGSAAPPLQGLLMHLAVSAIYGMLYGLLRYVIGEQRLARFPGWLAGLLYAMLLWSFAVRLLLPATQALILTQPWPVFFAGHIAYGLVLGIKKKSA